MSVYNRMIERMALEMPDSFRDALDRKTELIEFLKEGADNETESLHPESQEALESTIAEGQQMDAALHTWKHLSDEERNRVAEILVEAGFFDAKDELYYDFTTRLP